MPLFTAIGAALFGAGTFLAGATAFVLQAAAGIGLNLIAAAIKGKPTQEKVGIQGKLSAGGDVPRSIILGKYNTAGSLVYRNTYGQTGETPNAYYVEVRALSDLPVGGMVDVWVDGEKVGLVSGDYGFASTKHIRYGTKWGDIKHLWFQFYDGTQTTADPTLTAWFSGSDRVWGSDRIGTGVPYVIITALRNDLDQENPMFNGFPQCKFTIQGAKLYDPSRDGSVGGSGSHRYSDPSTWGGDGDDLPAVQIYNILRGITYGGRWLYGLQASSPAILPVANWIAAINKCRATVDGPDGSEAQYRSGIQIDVNVAPADAIEALLKTCNGRLTEVGGVYTIHVGEPDAPALSFSDADILSTEEQVYNPFRALADSINGAVAKYPEPLEGWNVKTSPPTKNPAQIVRDGDRELFADVDLSACPYHGQVQRLLKSAMLEALRERRHTIVLPPWAQVLEPGDIVSLTSDRNGYEDKWFRIDGMAYKANLDVVLQLTEVDPADYDWSQDDDYVPPAFAPMEIIRPAPQPIIAWYAEGQAIADANGFPRRPVIYLSWDGNKRDVTGVAYEIATTASDSTVMHRGRTDDAEAGSIIVSSQAFVPGETYYARGRYIPTSPRATEFSDWLPAVLPNLKLSLLEFIEGIVNRVTKEIDDLQNTKSEIEQVMASVASVDIARNWLDKKQQRRELASFSAKATAQITELWTVATDLDASLAQTTLDLTAAIDQANSQITITNTALSDLSQSVTTQNQAFTTQFGNVVATINAEIAARSDGDSALAGQISSFTTTLNSHTATLNTIAASVDGNRVQWGIVATISGAPSGGLVFQGVRTATGAYYSFAFRGDVVIDGTLSGIKIQAGTINTIQLAVNGVDINNLIKGAATNTVPFYFPSPGMVWTAATVGASPVTVCTGTVNIQSGAATVRIHGTWNQPAIGNFAGNDPGPVVCGFGLVVDGVFRRGFYYPMQMDKGYGKCRLCASFTEEYTVTGLSTGNHTFQIRSLHNGTSGPNEWGTSALPFQAIMLDGQMFVTDFRR